MKTSLLHVPLALTAICLGWPFSSWAADTANYVFNVPVNITNIGPGIAVQLDCMTSKETGQIQVVGLGKRPVHLDPSGSFSGTITIKIDYAPLADGKWVVPDSYQCTLGFLDPKTNKPAAQPPSRSKVMGASGKL